VTAVCVGWTGALDRLDRSASWVSRTIASVVGETSWARVRCTVTFLESRVGSSDNSWLCRAHAVRARVMVVDRLDWSASRPSSTVSTVGMGATGRARTSCTVTFLEMRRASWAGWVASWLSTVARGTTKWVRVVCTGGEISGASRLRCVASRLRCVASRLSSTIATFRGTTSWARTSCTGFETRVGASETSSWSRMTLAWEDTSRARATVTGTRMNTSRFGYTSRLGYTSRFGYTSRLAYDTTSRSGSAVATVAWHAASGTRKAAEGRSRLSTVHATWGCDWRSRGRHEERHSGDGSK
jgi:hypothetical protein